MKNKNSHRIWLVLAVIVLLIILILIAMVGYKEKEPLKIGVIMTGSVEDSGWNGMHYQGVRYACEKLETELLVEENVKEGTGKCAEAIEELVEQGASMIILTSYSYPIEVETVITKYPEISFYGISAEYFAENMTSYFGRMYQARYLAGIVAGMQSQTGHIGYVAAMPNSEVNRGINAFTLGVRSVNPQAQVHVHWTGEWDDEALEEAATQAIIRDTKADVITYHQNQHNVARVADESGVYSIGYNQTTQGLSEKYLTAAVWDWNALYYEIIREFMQGKSNSVKSHWFGMDTGVVKLSEYSSAVTEETIQAVEAAKEKMIAGNDVFSQVIYDNQGKMRCGEGEAIRDEILLEKMDWFVDGVVIYEKVENK